MRMETPPASGHEEIEELRRQLDEADYALLRTIQKRLEICTRIAERKREGGIAVMQPDRIELVQRRAEVFGSENGISKPFLRQLYDTIIAEACRVQRTVIDGGDGD